MLKQIVPVTNLHIEKIDGSGSMDQDGKVGPPFPLPLPLWLGFVVAMHRSSSVVILTSRVAVLGNYLLSCSSKVAMQLLYEVHSKKIVVSTNIHKVTCSTLLCTQYILTYSF